MSKKQNKNKPDKNLNNNSKEKNWVWILAILIITTFVFLEVRNYEFVNWDDDKNIYDNELITSLSNNNFWKNTKEIFTTKVIGNYNPLPIWTFAFEKQIYGLDNPGPWHLTNLLLHLIAVLLVFKICSNLSLNIRAILIISFLFALHPLRVESVAWVTERKDVLYAVFYLGAILQYIKWKNDHKSIRIFWIYFLFILSLFSKIQAVILPLSLLCIDYFLDKRIEFKNFLSKAPLFLLSLVFGVYGIYSLKEHGSLEANETYTGISRVFIGSYSLLIYMIKSIIPYRMSPLYPYPASIPWFFYVSFLVFPGYIYILYHSYKKQLRHIVFGMAFFFLNIVMLLQILGAGQGFIADRFTYVAYFGLFFIFGYYIDLWINKYPNYKKIITSLIAITFISYTFITFRQVKIWKNSGTMWSHVIKYYKNATLPYGNRANYYRDNGEIQKALKDYDKAVSLKPSAATFNSRARVFFDHGKSRDTLLLALENYSKAIEMDPDNGEYYVNRGATYARLNNNELALEDLNNGLKFKPNHATGYLNRSIIYQFMGRIDAALIDIKKYLEFHPYNADIWYEKARAERILKNFNVAIQDYTTAIKYNRNNPLFYYERSRTYYQIGQIENAKKDFQVALSANYTKIDPNYRALLGY